MTLRVLIILLAGLLLIPFAARAEDTLTPSQDPLDIWRVKPPEDQTQQLPPPQIEDVAPAPKPKAPPPKPVRKDVLRNDRPMHDATDIFDRKDFIVDNGKAPRHSLTYFWKVPRGFDVASASKQLYPLVIILPGGLGLAHAGEVLTRRDYRHDFPAFIAVPALPAGQTWAFPDSFPDDPDLSYLGGEKQRLSDVIDLIPQLLENNPIDGKRIYIIGCAEGGFGAYGAAMKYPNIFAAAVPINGGWAIQDANDLTKIPLFILHGEKDDTFPPRISRDVAYYIQLYGGDVHYVQVPGLAHDCSDDRLYSRAMWEWMFDQKKKRGVIVTEEPDDQQ